MKPASILPLLASLLFTSITAQQCIDSKCLIGVLHLNVNLTDVYKPLVGCIRAHGCRASASTSTSNEKSSSVDCKAANVDAVSELFSEFSADRLDSMNDAQLVGIIGEKIKVFGCDAHEFFLRAMLRRHRQKRMVSMGRRLKRAVGNQDLKRLRRCVYIQFRLLDWNPTKALDECVAKQGFDSEATERDVKHFKSITRRLTKLVEVTERNCETQKEKDAMYNCVMNQTGINPLAVKNDVCASDCFEYTNECLIGRINKCGCVDSDITPKLMQIVEACEGKTGVTLHIDDYELFEQYHKQYCNNVPDFRDIMPTFCHAQVKGNAIDG